MEYLAGQTLAERLEKGALPLDQALQCALQIADALDKAHRAGIVHRDLKPGNIFLVRRGGPSGPPDVKLLDFGLAKTQPAGAVAGGISVAAILEREPPAISLLQPLAPPLLDHIVKRFARGMCSRGPAVLAVSQWRGWRHRGRIASSIHVPR
jgi:eukaryotic-like serine/threonine-protein kinase